MPITVTSRDSGLTVALSGEIDHHGAQDMMAQLSEAIAARTPARLELDLSGVTFMDSSGIAVLLRAWAARSGPSTSPPRPGGCWTPPASAG